MRVLSHWKQTTTVGVWVAHSVGVWLGRRCRWDPHRCHCAFSPARTVIQIVTATAHESASAADDSSPPKTNGFRKGSKSTAASRSPNQPPVRTDSVRCRSALHPLTKHAFLEGSHRIRVPNDLLPAPSHHPETHFLQSSNHRMPSAEPGAILFQVFQELDHAMNIPQLRRAKALNSLLLCFRVYVITHNSRRDGR
jgi:hypothetical protein